MLVLDTKHNKVSAPMVGIMDLVVYGRLRSDSSIICREVPSRASQYCVTITESKEDAHIVHQYLIQRGDVILSTIDRCRGSYPSLPPNSVVILAPEFINLAKEALCDDGSEEGGEDISP